MAKKASEAISPPNQVGSPMRGFLSGAIESAGRMGDDATSPAGIAMSLLPSVGAARMVKMAGRMGKYETPLMSARPLEKVREMGTNVTPEFNNAAEAFEHYWQTSNKARGTMKDVPRNRAAVGLERERRSIQKPYRMEEFNPINNQLSPEFVPVGGETAFNAPRIAAKAAESAQAAKLGEGGSTSMPIGGDSLKIAEMMAKVARARGK